MPAMYECANHDYCGGYVIGISKTHLCDKCRETARQLDRKIKQDALIEQEYKRLNAKHPNKPTFQEIEREVK